MSNWKSYLGEILVKKLRVGNCNIEIVRPILDDEEMESRTNALEAALMQLGGTSSIGEIKNESHI